VDVEEGQEKLDIIHALCQRMVEKAGVPMKVYKTLDRRAALGRGFRHHPAARGPAEGA
jgi:6-phospho-beta-glucosidase